MLKSINIEPGSKFRFLAENEPAYDHQVISIEVRIGSPILKRPSVRVKYAPVHNISDTATYDLHEMDDDFRNGLLEFGDK